MDLFAEQESQNLRQNIPLAARMRPKRLEEFVGQSHFLGPGKLLRRMIDARRLGSVIFFGPPGCGKTTLAHLLAAETGGSLRQLSAVSSGVKELREVLVWARDEIASGGRRPLLFVDEIHRFNRTQQDALLPDVEEGIVSLIGATTSNPFFAINGALLSRSQVFQFQPLEPESLLALLQRALADREVGLGNIETRAEPQVLELLAQACEGDARRALSILEIAVLSSPRRPVQIDADLLSESMNQKVLQHDPTGDEHYDLVSALIKSMRGSDPDAAVYWLARMLEAGEDIRFICRRLVILASEDIGNADPQALAVAVSAMQACEFVGLPECQLTLSQAVIYLSLAPKSNSATIAISNAREEVRRGPLMAVPLALRDSHYSGAKVLGHGEGYTYPHDTPGGVTNEKYLPEVHNFFTPQRGWEQEKFERLDTIRKALNESVVKES